MIKHSICIVDDKIPAHTSEIDETLRINSSSLKYLREKVPDWDDPNVKEFVENILEKDYWTLSGFTNPNIFINCLEEELYRPEIVIFDWDYSSYPVGSTDVEESLLTILEYSFLIVFIFTEVDKQEEIRDLMKQPHYSKFKNRVKIKGKLDDNSVQELYEEIEKIRNQSFSFKFGAELRRNSLEAVDKILIELGKVSLDETVGYFKLSGDTSKDLIDFIGERFKNHLTASHFEELPEETKVIGEPELETAKQLWSYRLYFYHSEKDILVRKGDIIEKDNEFFIVVTADCDLDKFWHKNFGYLNILPIYEINEGNSSIKEKILLTRGKDKIKNELKKNPKYFKVHSFSNSIKQLVEGPIILPFLKSNKDNEFKDYIAFPKELKNIKVKVNPSLNKKKGLIYDANFDYRRMATISEPFLTPLIQHIFSTISGFGTPDYPNMISDLISENFGKIFK
ncbi:MAG: hypothetical protein PVH61_31815 [Candidatus Aminicenantes bacterium]